MYQSTRGYRATNPVMLRAKARHGRATAFTCAAMRMLLGGAAAMATLAGIPAVYGQSIPDDTEATRLDPIKVTDTPIDEQLSPVYPGGQVAQGGALGMLGNTGYMESPFSQTSYTAELVKNFQAITLTQLLEGSPSVRRSGGRFSSNDDVSVRGFSVSAADTAYDGVFGLGTFRRVPLEGIERVELLKGPSALLNGVPPEGGVGGIVNLIPKRATATPLTDITFSYASDSYLSGHLDAGRRFGASDAFGIRINAAHSDGDTPFDNNSETLSVGDIALDYIGEDFRLYANFNYDDQVQDASIFSGLSIASGIAIPDPPESATNLNAPFTKTETARSTNLISGEYDITDNWRAKLSYGWQRSDELQFVNFGARLINANGDYTGPSSYRLRTGDYDYQTVDAKLTGSFETGPITHNVSVAAYWLERTLDSLTQNASIAAGNVGVFNIYNADVFSYPRPNFTGITPSRSYSELIQEGIAISDTLVAMDDRLRLTVGAREQRIKNTNQITGVTDYDESRLSPAAAVSYRVATAVSLYGNYIQGLSRASSPPSTAVNADEIFRPAKTEQKEIGAKLDWGNLGGTVALFEITRPSGVTDPLTNIYSLSGQQRNRGIELETFGILTPGLRVLGGVAFLQPILTKTQNGTNDGKTATGTPQWRVNLSGEWDVPLVPRLTLTGQVLYTDEQYLDTANTLQIPDWTRVDLGARYSLGASDHPVTMRLRVTNLLDADYWETTGFVTGEPRTVSLSVAVRF